MSQKGSTWLVPYVCLLSQSPGWKTDVLYFKIAPYKDVISIVIICLARYSHIKLSAMHLIYNIFVLYFEDVIEGRKYKFKLFKKSLPIFSTYFNAEEYLVRAVFLL